MTTEEKVAVQDGRDLTYLIFYKAVVEGAFVYLLYRYNPELQAIFEISRLLEFGI